MTTNNKNNSKQNNQSTENNQSVNSGANLLITFSNTMKEFNLSNLSYKGKDDYGNEVEIKLEANVYTSIPSQPMPAFSFNTIPQVQTALQNTNHTPIANSAPNSQTSAPLNNVHIIKSPMIGVVYVASKPDAAPFIKAGDKIKPGQDIFIIECMKTMNLVKSNVSGTVKEILIKNAQPVEYDEKLVSIELD